MYKQNRTLKRLAIIALILTLSTMLAAHAAAETTVSVDAPEYVLSDTFDVEIKIKDVYELDTGEFHLIFDPNVVDVTDVTAGDIGDMNVGFANKRSDKTHGIGIIKVTFDISGTGGVSGSGSLSTISFEVTGGEGNCSFLNISNPTPIHHIEGFEKGALIPWDPDDEITAKWENGIVRIGDPSSFDDPPDSDNSTDSNTSTPDTPKASVAIFVENCDDDDSDIYLYIDGNFDKTEKVKKDENKEYYKTRKLTEGVHTFKIEWHDYDTDKDYVKIEDHSVSGTTAVALRTEEHTEDDVDKLSACVYVKNLDNDDLDEVYLYIDGVYRKYKSISSDSVGDYGEYEFEEDEDALHLFKIEWFDPGTGVTYEKIVRSYITTEEAVTLYVDKHTEEDIILLSGETAAPVSTISKSSSTTSTRTVKEPTPSPTKTQITEMHTDPAPAQDSPEDSDMKQHISATCTLLAFVAVLFVLMQIRRI
jgi:hypothetical protein